MKPIIMSIYLIMGAILAASGAYRTKVQRKEDREIAALLYLAAFANFVQAVFFATDSLRIMQVSSTLYSISIIWIVFFSAVFMERFTKVYKEIKKVKFVCHMVAVVDSLLLLVNIFVPIFYTIVPFEEYDRIFYTHGSRTPLFYVHMAACVLLLIIPFAALTNKTVYSIKSFYRKKYMLVFLLALVAIGVALHNAVTDTPMDITIVIFGIAVLIAEYMYGYKFPRLLREETSLMSIQQMTDIACIYDIDENLVFVNESGKKHISPESLAVVTEDAQLMAKQEINQSKDHFTWNDKILIKSEDGEEHEAPFQIRFRRLRQRNEVIGYYLVLHDRTEEIENFKRDRYHLTHDELTDLYNRDHFFEVCHRILALNPNQNYYFVLSDIDNFKLFNELYGSKRGDEVLLAEAELLRRLCSEHSIYGRLNGDKFAVLVPEERYTEEIFINCISKLRKDFSQNSFKIVVNAGVYKVTDHSEALMSMYNKAQLAIASIGNDYSTVLANYTQEMLEKTLRERWLLDELPGALEREEFKMYLQPQVHAETGKWLGAEALVRWMNKEKGMISPGTFVPLFERMGVIGRVDEVIWEQAARKIHEWNELGREDLYISVNISGADFYHFDIYDKFTGLVEKYQLNPKQLKLEITESFMVEDSENRKTMLEKLRAYGFTVEIDDFGSGYSALNSLKDIPCDVIKVDMGFLRKTENVEQSNIILEMVLGLIKRLKKQIVTEGVETKDQTDYLCSIGCDIIQGYYYSKPIPVSEFEAHVLEKG